MMKLVKSVLLLFAFLLLINCKPTQKSVVQEPQNSDSLFITIERSPCFGRCPWYEVKIYDKGFVLYNGKKDTDKMGLNTAVLSKEDLKKLKSAAVECNYMNLQDKYDNPRVTDLPSTETSVKLDGTRKSIYNRIGGPKELNNFEKFIDEILNQQSFVKMMPVDSLH